MEVKKKYPALHSIANVYGFLAWALAGIGVIAAAISFMQDNIIAGVGALVGGVILWLSFKATAEVLHVVMDIEVNTRKSELMAERQSIGAFKEPVLQ